MLRLESERQRLGISKSELARRAGMATCTVIEATTGKRLPGPSQRVKLARALGWPEEHAAELLEDVQA